MRAPAKLTLTAWITAICLLGDSAFYILLPVLYQQFGLSSLWEVGVLLAVNRFIRIPIHPLVKKYYLAQTFVSQGLMIGFMLTVASNLACGLLEGFWPLFGARVVWGIAWSLIRQGGQITLVQVSGQIKGHTGEWTGHYNGIARIGTLTGMIFAGFAPSFVSVEFIYFGFVCLLFVTFPFLYLKIIAEDTKDTKTVKKAISPERKESRSYIKKQWLYLLLPGFLIAFMFQGVWKATLGYWIAGHDFSGILLLGGLSAVAWTGLLQGFRWTLEPVLAPWIGRWADKGRNTSVLFPVSLLTAAVLFLFIPREIPSMSWLVIAGFLMVTAISTSVLIDAAAVQEAVAGKNKAEKQAVVTNYLIASDLGAAAGPITGFVLIEQAGELAFGALACCILSFTALLLIHKAYAINRCRSKKGNCDRASLL